jgi:hypothetical protein
MSKNNWTKNECVGERATRSLSIFLHDTLHHNQPPLSNREPDAASGHRFPSARCPAEKPEIVADREVEIHDRVSYIRGSGHPLVYVHVHAVIVSEGTCDQ